MALVVHYSVSDEADSQVGPAFHQKKDQVRLESTREQLAARRSLGKLRGQKPGQPDNKQSSNWSLKQRWCKFMQTGVRKSKASLK